MPDSPEDPEVVAFFTAFESASESLDIGALTACFADSFMAADPSGAQPVPRAAFLSILPKRKALFTAAGIANVSLTGLEHRSLDDSYVIAHTTWTAERDDSRLGEAPVTLLSTFILNRTVDGLRIVFYLNHKNLDDALSPGRDATS
jgi:ketosteroid isomerase-like protein